MRKKVVQLLSNYEKNVQILFIVMLPPDIRIEDEVCNLRFIRKSRATTNPERHFHSSWEFLYVASGSRTFFYRSATYAMGEGAIAIIPPGILHRGLNQKGETCELYNIYVLDQNNPLFSSLLPLCVSWVEQHDPVIQFDEKSRYEVESLFQSMGMELQRKEPWYVQVVWAQLALLVALSCRSAAQAQRGTGQQQLDPRIQETLHWIDLHYAEPIDLERVAQQISMSPAYFSKLFYRTTQIHFHEYLASVRIQRACSLLATTREPVYRIAERCGFGSITQFGRLFRQLTGQHPLEYRRKTNAQYTST